MDPAVTVLMPVYNRSHMIHHAINSILGQTFADFELLIIDDGSTDETVTVIKAYKDSRIRLVCHETNWGQTPTRNHGLELARGQYIAMLDSDDVAVPFRLEQQVRLLENRPDLGEVGGWIRHLRADGGKGRIKRLPTSSRDIRAQMAWRSSIAHTTVMMRAALAKRLQYDSSYEQAQDYEFHSRLLSSHEIANIPAVLSYKRAHPGQISKSGEAGKKSHEFKKKVMSRFIRQLGLEPPEAELDKHFALTRAKATGQPIDKAYLRWAKEWLGMLIRNNSQYQVFPEPEFSRYVNRIWRNLWLLGFRQAPWQAGKAFMRSISGWNGPGNRPAC